MKMYDEEEKQAFSAEIMQLEGKINALKEKINKLKVEAEDKKYARKIRLIWTLGSFVPICSAPPLVMLGLPFEVTWLCFALGGGFFIGYPISLAVPNWTMKAKLKRYEKKLKALLWIDEKAIRFYEECSKLIAKGNDKEQVFSIVGQRYNFTGEQAAAYYNKGAKEIMKSDVVAMYKYEKAEKGRFVDAHHEEQIVAKEICEKKNKTGKEKYLILIREWHAKIEHQKKGSKAIQEVGQHNAFYVPRERDWAVAGGAASALGGTACGVATAREIQVQNEKDKANAPAIREKGRAQQCLGYEMEEAAEGAERRVLNYLSMMESVLVDGQNKLEKFKLLECSTPSIALTPGGNLSVSLNVKLLAEPTILSNPAILDGVLKVSVLKKNGKVISTGYYIADGYGKYNYSKAGFKKEENITIICPIDHEVNVEELTCEVTPESLWTIEKNSRIFNVSNKSIENEYKAHQKAFAQQAVTAMMSL